MIVATVTYTAKACLVTGHVAGEQYSIVFKLAEHEPAISIKREQAKSLSGRIETVVHHRAREFAITTEPFNQAGTDAFTEFLASVLDGSTFIFDRNATALDGNGDPVPVRPRECQLVDDDFKQKEWRKRGTFQFSFRARETTEPLYGENY